MGLPIPAYRVTLEKYALEKPGLQPWKRPWDMEDGTEEKKWRSQNFHGFGAKVHWPLPC